MPSNLAQQGRIGGEGVAFDRLQLAAFGDGGDLTQFPIHACSVTGSIRDFIHVYPHASGGSPEKMGRNLYLIRMEANFQDTFAKYPGLWPGLLNKLFHVFENQTTASLVIPTVGTIQAYCRNWSKTMSAKIRSGEMATFEFVEDSATNFLSANVPLSPPISVAAAQFGTELDAQKALDAFRSDATTESLFDSIQDSVNAVLAVGDTIQATGQLVLAKLLQLQDNLSQLDGHRYVNDPSNALMIEAYANLRDSVQQTLNGNPGGAGLGRIQRPQTWQVPHVMPMSAVSINLFGDPSHQIELMQMNDVYDIFRVPQGQYITYVPAP